MLITILCTLSVCVNYCTLHSECVCVLITVLCTLYSLCVSVHLLWYNIVGSLDLPEQLLRIAVVERELPV